MIRHPFLALAAATLHALAGFALADPVIESHPAPYPEFGSILRHVAELDELLDAAQKPETLAKGFTWSEGPVWDFAANRLYFSDVPENIVYQWEEGSGVSIYLSPSGFTGESHTGGSPGANGLAFDNQGRLVLCQHGDRRVARLNERRRGFTTIVDSFESQPLNSPNDLVYDAQGALYFTDPPYGLSREISRQKGNCPVYRVSPDGAIALLTDALSRPNGIALSPDDSQLYLNDSDRKQLALWRLALDNEPPSQPEPLFDFAPFQAQGRPGACDGLAIDERGNIWTTGPGGVYILDPQGKHLGTLLLDTRAANCAFGGPDGRTLFITAHDKLLRIRTKVRGHFPFEARP